MSAESRHSRARKRRGEMVSFPPDIQAASLVTRRIRPPGRAAYKRTGLTTMKRLILGVAAALLLSAGPAAADGLPSKGAVKAAAPVEAAFSWRGLYAGLH